MPGPRLPYSPHCGNSMYKIQHNSNGQWLDVDWRDNGKLLRFEVPQLAEEEIQKTVAAYNSSKDYSHTWTREQFRVVTATKGEKA